MRMKNMRNHTRKCLLLLTGILSLPTTASAEYLGMVVVTATRTERKVSDVPASVSVITEQDIKESTAKSVDELLQGKAGVYVSHGIGAMSVSTSNKVIMRGMGGSTEARVLMLIDGVPANEEFDGGIEWNKISIDDVKRIEVVRGAASALYGSNAMGGVINIITKKPSDNTQAKVSLGYGSMNTTDNSASLSGRSGALGYRISGGMLKSDGYQPLQEKNIKATSIDKGTERENFRGLLSYDLSDTSSISISGDYYHNQTTGTYDIPGYNPFEQKSKSINAKYINRLSDGREFSAMLYAKAEDSSYDSANYATGYTTTKNDSVSEQNTIGGNLQYTFPLSFSDANNNIVTTGLDFRQGDVDRQDTYYDGSGRLVRVKGSQRYAGIYLQDEIFLLDDDLVLNIGGRYDYWKNYDGYNYDNAATQVETYFEDGATKAFSPKLGAVYHLTPSTSIRGSVGKAFRAPTLYDLYRTYISGTLIYSPNPNLGPEKVMSYEIGLDQQIGDAANLSVSLYRNDAEDFISSVSVACTVAPYTRCYEKQNIGEVSTQGVEIDFDYAISQRWELTANYTFNRSLVEEYSPDPTLEGNLLPYTPLHTGAISMGYTNPALFDAKATVRYVGQRYSDDKNDTLYHGYALVDLHVSKDLGEHYNLSLDINDLFDDGYTEYYISPGRTVMAKLSASF